MLIKIDEKQVKFDSLLQPDLFILSDRPIVDAFWHDMQSLVGDAQIELCSPNELLDKLNYHGELYRVVQQYSFNREFGEFLVLNLEGEDTLKIRASAYINHISVPGNFEWL